jgi:hypothetical protein
MSNSSRRFDLSVLPDSLAIVRLGRDASLPSWATHGEFFSVTRTSEELSIVCPARQVPPGVTAETGWRALKVAGPFALSEVGVLASLAAPLAKASVSLFVISTFDTDYLIVTEKQLPAAIAALTDAGHRVQKTSAAS